MILLKLEQTLVLITEETYRSTAPEGTEPPYLVFDDDGQSDGLYGDGKMVKQGIEGTIDLFTKTEDDPLFDLVQKKLNDAGIGFRYNSKQYEEGTGITHYEWIWNIIRSVE